MASATLSSQVVWDVLRTFDSRAKRGGSPKVFLSADPASNTGKFSYSQSSAQSRAVKVTGKSVNGAAFGSRKGAFAAVDKAVKAAWRPDVAAAALGKASALRKAAGVHATTNPAHFGRAARAGKKY